jgi:hypothetical protein
VQSAKSADRIFSRRQGRQRAPFGAFFPWDLSLPQTQFLIPLHHHVF